MTYQLLTDVEHVLKRPDMYVGSIEKDKDMVWVLEDLKIIQKRIVFSPALPKLFDETIANAVDNHIRGRGTSRINITLSPSRITVENNGTSIPFDTIGGLPTPTVLFGCLRSGENFDDEIGRSTGGKNGYGIKLANIFSSEFEIDIVNQGRRFRQKWTNNMQKRLRCHITMASKKKDYVKVSFVPDFKRFGCKCLEGPTLSILKKRAMDAVFCYPGLSVRINGKQIFKKPLDYLKALSAHVPLVSQTKDWTVCVFQNPIEDDMRQISFANGISTSRGGTHVKHVIKILTKILSSGLSKRKLKPSSKLIKDALFVIVRMDVVNPVFESQCKTILASKVSKFKSQWQPSQKFCKSLLKSSIFEHLIEVFSNKLDKQMARQDGKKSCSVTVPKLIDAKYAGTVKSDQCVLILAEGDSALSMLLSGVTSNRLQKTVGLFPLRGKLLNCATAGKSKLMVNTEIQNLKKIIGLSNGRIYKDTKALRYGKILVATDADDDGQHILGLVLTMFHKLYPNLISLGYVNRFVTPLLIAKKGNTLIELFTLQEYKDWKAKTSKNSSYTVKFYKGLGSSTNADAKRYFSNMSRYSKELQRPKDGLSSLDMFFSKDHIEARKIYVKQPKHQYIEGTLDGFVKGPLHGYARSSLIRAIPSIDGFKESTRKILWTCLDKKIYGEKKDIKVSELAGLVSKYSHYHHGETSLQGAIVTLARRFKTINSVPLLVNSGQFGSYVGGGADSASARYIFTRLEERCKLIFNSADFMVLPRQIVDGELAETKLLAPLLPWSLVNGAAGIGTGFSTNIFPYNIHDVIEAASCIIQGTTPVNMTPSFNNWDGVIASFDGYFTSTGKHTLMSSTKIHISSLPIGVFPTMFLRTLNKLKTNGMLKSFDTQHTEHGPQFTVTFVSHCDMISALSLTKKHSLQNMHLLDCNGILRKYDSAIAILEDYVLFKVNVTSKRISCQIKNLQVEINTLRHIQTFIALFLNGDIPLKGMNESNINNVLKKHNIEKFQEKLLNLPLRRLTQHEINRATSKMEHMHKQLIALQETSPSKTYLAELRTFQKSLRTDTKRASSKRTSSGSLPTCKRMKS